MDDVVVRCGPAHEAPESGEDGGAEYTAAAEARALRQLAPRLHLEAHVANARVRSGQRRAPAARSQRRAQLLSQWRPLLHTDHISEQIKHALSKAPAYTRTCSKIRI